MATCLKCDGCNAVVTERDDELPAWWTVERYGDQIIDEPGRRNPYQSMMPTIQMSTISVMEMDEDGDGPPIMEFLGEPDGIDIALTLHFCSANCLAEWASEAAAFEA